MKLGPTTEKFILHWGEMGTRWGVNRTVAQIHALLYLSPEPLNAETITETLGVARSNVSTSLRELQSWGLVRVVHVLGDRRDHFESLSDIWDIFMAVIEERKRRELDPTLTTLRDCVMESESDQSIDPQVAARIRDTLEFMEMLTGWYEQMKTLPRPTLVRILNLGAKLQNLLGRGKKAAPAD
ncbi:MAG TPA: MarR family transcriptional regulator [Gammaproteobacteria bacterium]|nr:MarR family transcriptional regulator [Gammaproteobacteria bacterium]